MLRIYFLLIKTCCDHRPNIYVQFIYASDTSGVYPFGKPLLRKITIKNYTTDK